MDDQQLCRFELMQGEVKRRAREIVDDLEAALEQFRLIAGDLAAAATQD